MGYLKDLDTFKGEINAKQKSDERNHGILFGGNERAVQGTKEMSSILKYKDWMTVRWRAVEAK